MKIMILNGPNINLIGKREPNFYGQRDYNYLVKLINRKKAELNINISVFQSNSEGKLVDYIHEAFNSNYDGLIINPGAYTHTSIAIMDAIIATSLPAIEVHISNINNREDFRAKSMTAKACIGQITGLGLYGYLLAIDGLFNYIEYKSV